MGKNVRALVVGEAKEQTAEKDENPAVKQLLEKARKLNINVVIETKK